MKVIRKFLVKKIPNLENIQFIDIIQSYLSFKPEIKLKNINNEYYYLMKKDDRDLINKKTEVTIDKMTYEIFTELIQGRTISKTRYNIMLKNGLIAEVDMYHEELNGLITVQTEFDSMEQAIRFKTPDWYGKEITSDKRYKNRNLATCDNHEINSLTEQVGKHSLNRKIIIRE